MRTENAQNKKDKYILKIIVNDVVLLEQKVRSYKHITEICPTFKNEDAVRSYFRRFKHNGCKHTSTKKLFGNYCIEKIPVLLV